MVDRQFFKESRRENFDDSGSIRLTEIESQAYRNLVTLELVDIEGFRYYSYKSLPPSSFYGHATVFHGAAVSKIVPVNFQLFRLSDTRNEMLWHRYSQQEAVQFQGGYAAAVATEASGGAIEFLLDYVETLAGPVANAWEWIIEKVVGDGSDPQPDEYTALPVDTPHPTVVKFKSDIPIRFSLRLDSWYLVNPVVYIVGSAADSSDPTDGENEYQPPGGTGNPEGGNYGDGNESTLPPDSDPNDVGEGLPPTDPGYGFVVPGPGVIQYEYFNNVQQIWQPLSKNGFYPFTLECREESDRNNIYAVWNGGEVALVTSVPFEQTTAVRNVVFVDSTGSGFQTGLTKTC